MKLIKFECNHCGRCCQFNHHAPLLTVDDVERYRRAGLPKQVLVPARVGTIDGVTFAQNGHGGCFWWVNGRCAIYQFRPTGCEKYPEGESTPMCDASCFNEVDVPLVPYKFPVQRLRVPIK